ncbi:MAG: DUF86 domain-containing protein [Armatimonadetes bacterium]|nr:DUF86 domain-containing protein [Armatimonadota bacterium]
MTKPIIYELLEEIQRNLDLLQRLRAVPEEAFVSDPERYLLAERCFQLAIQCLLDISFYIASQQGWQRPESSSEAVLLMGTQGVLTREFSEKIVGMANFRNVLVHAYLKIDRHIVYRFLSDLDDFREFSRQVLDYLETEAV